MFRRLYTWKLRANTIPYGKLHVQSKFVTLLIPRWTPSTGALNTRGRKKCDFRPKSPFISETVRDAHSIWNTNRKSWVARSIRVGSNDIEWRWKAGREGSKFSGRSPQLRSNGLTYRMTEFGTVTQLWSSIFMVGQPRPHLEGRGPASPKFLGTSCLRPNLEQRNVKW